MPRNGQVFKPRVSLGRSPDDCWEWLGSKTAGGYGKKQYCGKTMLAHRWIWSQLFGAIPDGKVIHHTCQNPGCVNPHHLTVTTQADNCRQSLSSVLTPGDVTEIRAVPNDQRTGKEAIRLASEYCCSRQLIHDIWAGRAWQRAKPFYGPTTIAEADQ